MIGAFGKGDWLIVVLMLLLVYYLFITFWRPGAGEPEYVHIISGDKEVLRAPLRDNAIIPVAGLLGETRLQISDGRVRVLSSACRRKLCVHRGWSDHNGEIIACLPNRVSAYLSGPPGDYDSVNF